MKRYKTEDDNPMMERHSTSIQTLQARAWRYRSFLLPPSPPKISRKQGNGNGEGHSNPYLAMQDGSVDATTKYRGKTFFEEGTNDMLSAALIGFSMLGNLDGIYEHSVFQFIKLHTSTTGSRRRDAAL